MGSRLDALEEQVAALSRAVEELRAKVEQQAAPGPMPRDEVARLEAPAPPRPPEAPAEPALPLLGRTLLAFAGAFVIRTLTDRGVLPAELGVALGLAFSVALLGVAWRDAARERRRSAAFHGAASALIGYPLVVETGSRLGVLSAPVAAVALGGLTLVLAVVAAAQRLPALGWFGALGGTAAAGALLGVTGDPAPFRVALAGVALVAVLLADRPGQEGPRWVVALTLDALLLHGLVAPSPGEAEALGVGSRQGLMALTAAVFLGALAWRTWRRARPVQTFEVLQTLAVVALGLITLQQERAFVAEASLLLALASLATAVHLGATDGRREDAWFFGLIGLGASLLVGAAQAGPVPLAAVWGALALAAAATGRVRLPGMAWGFAAVWCWAAAGAAGLLGVVRAGLWDAPGVPWAEVSLPAALALGLAAAAYALMTVQTARRDDEVLRVLALGVLSLVGVATAALLAFGVRQALGGEGANATAVLVARSLVLVGLAAAAALARRRGGPPEFAWGAAGLLALCGLKLLVQDLPSGNAAAPLVGFLALGLSVSLLPKVVKPRPPSEAPTPPPATEPTKLEPPTPAPAQAPSRAHD